MKDKLKCSMCGLKDKNECRFVRFKDDRQIYCEVCVTDLLEAESDRYYSENFEEIEDEK